MAKDLGPAARRYAQAVFELATANGDAEAWERALDQMAAFMSGPEASQVLQNTRVDPAMKQQLIDAALGDLPKLPLNLARLLVRKGRTNLASAIAEHFKQLIEDQEGISRAHATTAVPLSETERAALAERLHEQTGRRVLLDTSVDPAIIGGVVVQIGDRLIDASTRGRLAALRESLVGSLG